MNNQHNPIAVRIDNINDLWEKSKKQNSDIKLFNLISNSVDYPLIQGFLQLATSEYSKTTDTFVVQTINFNSITDFYHTLIDNWLNSFESDLKKYPDWDWKDFNLLKKRFSEIDYKTDKLKNFFIEILNSFKKFEDRNDSDIILTLIVNKIENSEELYDTLQQLHSSTPSFVSILLIDSKERNIYEKMIKKSFKDCAVTIEVPNQDIFSAYEEIATQGSPNDPHVQYRKCLFDMGKAAQNNDKNKVKELGDKLIKISEGIREINLIASSHLIYAGFLFQFKVGKLIYKLLNKGMELLEPYYTQDESSANIYIQLLMHKASYFSIDGDKKKAIALFEESAIIAKKMNLPIQAINSYNYALILALKKERNIYEDILVDAFNFGYSLSDEYLKPVNLTFIVNNYIERMDVADSEKDRISKRMINLYGEDWELTGKELGKKMLKEYSTSK